MKKGKEILGRIFKDIKEYGWALAAFLVCYALIHVIFDAFCPLLVLTGIPCAGCGLTRAFLFLFSGQFARAMYMNPSVLLVLAFVLYFVLFRYVLGRKVKGLNVCLALLVAGMLIIYGYRMWMYFPDRVPYVYHENNILANRFPLYQDLVQRLIARL
ncbi:MAG: DUF2752 domain-containing protein [Lachnospiraceae bacterium]|nr:DUF2752 domain-containing protein [Lachnospiraceae bacterium]